MYTDFPPAATPPPQFPSCLAREDRAQEYDINSKRAILNRVIHPPLEQKNGYLAVPEGPGLGLEVDEDGLRKLRLS